MKVVSLNFSTSGSSIGGASNAAFNLSLEISKTIPHTLFRMWDNNSSFIVNNTLSVRNFATSFPFLFHKKNSYSRLFCYSNFKACLLSELPDIVHIHNVIPSLHLLSICIILKAKGVKIVFSSHGFYEVFSPRYEFSFGQLAAWYLLVTIPVWFALLISDHIFTGYPGQINELWFLPKKQSSCSLLPNGANPRLESITCSDFEILELQQSIGVNPSLPTLLYVGNHTKNKGFNDLIALSSSLKFPCNIVICGKIRDPQVCLEMNDAAAPAVNVVFTDFLSDEKIQMLYISSDLLLFPSKSDTLPLSIIDSMACETLVVAYSLPGIEYLLGPDYPLLVKNFSTDSFVDAVHEFFLFDQMTVCELEKHCFERQRSFFNWPKAAQDSINVYRSLLNSDE